MGYEWDVFVSYPRRDPIGPWVHDRFLPVLQRWLNAALPSVPRIFVDEQMQGGAHWPSTLADALQRSRYMVAVLAPPYFGSSWCMSEWQTMKAREEQLGLGRAGSPGLVRAIRFFDGDTFPADARAVQADDFTCYNLFPPGRTPLKTRPYREFERKVQAMCQDLATRIAAVPPWDPSWPVMRSPDPAFDTSLSFQHVALTRDPR
ncbi:MAG TPA: toll/interleukin-1 receptor domain-containing protein [Kofleriaceae bacterium]|nr:toll/interleukin-1 receptor domain-containing protein [Kofleriaceae bacterium]